MPKFTLPKELIEEGRPIAAELRAAEFTLTNMRTDSTEVLHEVHNIYIRISAKMDKFWDKIYEASPIPNTEICKLNWRGGYIVWGNDAVKEDK
jgi:hypothetical protein